MIYLAEMKTIITGGSFPYLCRITFAPGKSASILISRSKNPKSLYRSVNNKKKQTSALWSHFTLSAAQSLHLLFLHHFTTMDISKTHNWTSSLHVYSFISVEVKHHRATVSLI
jgi:hypothetical protein